MKPLHLAAGALALSLGFVPMAFAQSSSGYGALQQDNRSRFDAWFQHFDANGDGIITHDEYVKAQDDRFRAADANGDGQLTKDEVLTYMQQREGRAAPVQ